MKIEQEQIQFYAAIGSAIQAWAVVETQFALYFSFLLIGQAGHPLATIPFSNQTSLRGRLELADNAIAYRWTGNSGVQKEWRHIRERLDKCNSQRNAIVHYAASWDREAKEGRRLYLLPSPLSSAGQHASGPPPGLYVSDIRNAQRNFEILAGEIGQANRAFMHTPREMLDLFHPERVAEAERQMEERDEAAIAMVDDFLTKHAGGERPSGNLAMEAMPRVKKPFVGRRQQARLNKNVEMLKTSRVNPAEGEVAAPDPQTLDQLTQTGDLSGSKS